MACTTPSRPPTSAPPGERRRPDPVPPPGDGQAGRATLSLAVITRDEERNIGRCLASLAGLADETLVVDCGSTDRTRALATAAGARVLVRRFDGYGPQKQFALEQTRGDWVLCLDADEWLDAPAREAVAALLERPPPGDVNGARLPMRCRYLDRWLRHGPFSGERKLRLVRRGRARWDPVGVHESLRLTAGRTLDLPGHILHQPYRDLGHQLRKIDRYTDLIARRDAATPAWRAWFGMLLEPPLVFFQGYLLRLGFLDGRPGFLAAALHAFYFFLRYARIRERSGIDTTTEITEITEDTEDTEEKTGPGW